MNWLAELLGIPELLARMEVKLSLDLQHQLDARVPPPQSLFHHADIKVYARDADITQEFEQVAGTFVRGVFTCSLVQTSDKLSNEEGVLYIIPQAIQDQFHYGGMGQSAAGSGWWANEDFSDFYPAVPSWHRLPDGRMAVRVHVWDGQRMVLLEGPRQPESWQYGFRLGFSIAVP